MNIKWKFAILAIAVCSLSLLVTFVLWFVQKNEADTLAEQKGRQVVVGVEKILALKSGYYRKQANDYAHWNDLVRYVGTKDSRWAKDNLDGSLEEFGSNGVYVIDTDKTVIYANSDRAPLKDLYAVVNKNQLNIKEPNETHFFVKTSGGVVEFFGAPIRRSTHEAKADGTYGYFLVAKQWDEKYIDEIEEIAHIEAKIEEEHKKYADESKNTIIKDIALMNLNGQKVANLHISIKNEMAQIVEDYTKDALKIGLIHAAIIIAIFMFLMLKYLTIPLMNISTALKQKNIEPIKNYLDANNEYGNISREINDSFESKNKLKELNAHLEQRVCEEVEKNRQKDQILFQQSKNAAIGELISLIAHQWRQPLNALGIMIQTTYCDVHDGVLDLKELEECKGKGMELVNSMSSTIDSFRNFFLPDMEKETFCVESSIDSSVNIISGLFESANIQIARHYVGKHDFFGYKKEFEQTMLNLLLNAQDAIQTGNIAKGMVDIFVTKNADNISIEIRDNGIGVSPAIKDKIFDPYFTTKHQAHGVGVGLYMVKQIVEKHHGGKISVGDTQAGASFVIELPAADVNG